MFHLIPSNRQENLVAMLHALLTSQRELSAAHPFEPDTIVVESMGMKHYLSMELARSTGITINLEFPLLVRSVYQLCRAILGDDAVPKESLYKREILLWRIYEILGRDDFLSREDCAQAHRYWQDPQLPARKSSDANTSAFSQQRRYALAKETADVFEQYMQFRPKWIKAWQNAKALDEEDESLAQAKHLIQWQRILWQMLVGDERLTHQQSAAHPVAIIEDALAALRKRDSGPTLALSEDIRNKLPKAIHIFAVNAISEQHLAFFDALSEHIDVYFFYLNPCMEYWGDLLSDKARARAAIVKSQSQLLDEDSPNPLLANLGQQGRALFNQFQQYDFADITQSALYSDALNLNQVSSSSFQAPIEDGATSLLANIQSSLLKLDILSSDKQKQLFENDNSVSIHSCHSTVREIQVLHDELLFIMQQNPNIKPHDVIVLCPSVEDYAPYVSSVFASAGNINRSSHDLSHGSLHETPRLVCSVADRSPLDADPMVALFMDMLKLPDSRFSAPQVLDYLSLPSIRRTFSITQDELEQMENWVEQANIYWAIDADHKQAILACNMDDNPLYTWLWGIERIIKGSLSYSIETPVNSNYLPIVKGLQWQAFGKMQAFISQLDRIRVELGSDRSMQQWHQYLIQQVLDQLFDESERKDGAYVAIKRGIDTMLTNVDRAQLNEKLSLLVMQQELSTYFSTPDALNRYNTGQVTFSSMVPMRSVPFKVVCMLGLNDGIFPRSTEFASVNIMGFDTPQRGDRSRKNEDRYLFLEAIMSAREHLYLSYQGQDQYNNKVRSPSLVLSELRDFIAQRFDKKIERKHSLQAFNLHVFDENKPQSFDADWLNMQTRIALSNIEKAELSHAWPLSLSNAYGGVTISTSVAYPSTYSDKDISALFKSPLNYLIKTRFGIDIRQYFDSKQSNEPFRLSKLVEYKFEQACIEQALKSVHLQDSIDEHSDLNTFSLSDTFDAFVASGDFPQQALQGDTLAAYQKPVSLDVPSVDINGLHYHRVSHQPSLDDIIKLVLPFSESMVSSAWRELCQQAKSANAAPGIELGVTLDDANNAVVQFNHPPAEHTIMGVLFGHCIGALAAENLSLSSTRAYFYYLDVKDKSDHLPLCCDVFTIAEGSISINAAQEFVALVFALDFIALHTPCFFEASHMIAITSAGGQLELACESLEVMRTNMQKAMEDKPNTNFVSINEQAKSFLLGANILDADSDLPANQPYDLLEKLIHCEALNAVMLNQNKAEAPY
ncbi:exodeoxyribonuclease V subunit gamma [Ningiella sp. W23]|uniref:exodeoxyribonuclease V subunit gamma n=1 Tax=Ningiella sp. W23 TaxID=3023715 RepID=UPI00375656D4